MSEIVHRCPVAGCSLTPCCQKSPFELPLDDRMTDDPKLVTCTKSPSVPPEGVKDENTREVMQKIAHLVNEELPDGWGFFVMAFPFENGEGRMNYVSNARRDTVQELMEEFINKGGHNSNTYDPDAIRTSP